MRKGFKHTSFLKLLLTILLLSGSVAGVRATTYYSRTNGGNWNAAATWSTITYGGAAASSYPLGGDTVKIGDGYTINIASNSACAIINIGQRFSGVLAFLSTASYTLSVSNSILIRSGASLIYSGNNSRAHTLNLTGDFVNNGTVDLLSDANDYVNLTINGSMNSVVSGTGTWSLRNVTMYKTSISYTLEVQANAFETGMSTLTAISGTYIHNNSGTYPVNPTAAVDYTLASTVAFKVPQGTVNFAPNRDRMYLQGALYVNGGNVTVGTTAGNVGILYDQNGLTIPYLEVTAGTLDVYGGIYYKQVTNAFNFKMTGGTVLLNNGTVGTRQGVFMINDDVDSEFYMSDGTITIQKHNSSGGTDKDWSLCGTLGTVTSTGGTVQFGNGSTVNNTIFDFETFPNVVQPNFKITGTTGYVITLMPIKNSTTDFMLLSLYIDTNKVFDIRSIQGTNGDTKTMTITSTFDGTCGFYNKGTFTSRSGTVVLGGNAPQTIDGSSVTDFYNLTIQSTSDVTLEGPENVTNYLTMSTGKLITTATNILTCTSGANANIGSTTSYVDGPMIHTIASMAGTTKYYPIGKNSDYRPAVLTANHSSITSVTYLGEVTNSSATALGYALPSTIAKVSYVRYWNFARQSVPNFTSATMQLYYSTDDSVADRTKIRLVHDDGSALWVDLQGSGTANVTGTITSISFNSFKTKFAIGVPPAPLPIELTSFEAIRTGDSVTCSWITASEINNQFFTIERSIDGIHFDSLDNVTGAGSTSSEHSYSYVDHHPLTGNSYYRIKQTDFDGHFTHSQTEHIYYEKYIPAVTFFPNPSSDNFIYISSDDDNFKSAQFVVEDLNGKKINTTAQLMADNKTIQLNLDPANMIAENYFVVSVLSGGSWVKERILVGKK